MAEIFKIATMNINGIKATGRMRMLHEFIQRQELDIILLQEVTHHDFEIIQGYDAFLNVGTNRRGTGILARQQIPLSNITQIPSGRGIAAQLRDTWLVNIYAPAGTAKRTEREVFFNTEIAYLIRTLPTNMILGGDFNCVLSRDDCTGAPHFSRALDLLVRSFDLQDAWSPTTNNKGYTRYTHNGAARLDRIYMSTNLSLKKTGIETVCAAFTDHLAVVVRL